MSLTLFEFAFFGFYLAMITLTVILIQVYNPGGMVREAMTLQDKGEPFAQAEVEEPDSDSDSDLVKPPFNPDTEPYTMTENPMLRNRMIQKEPDATPLMEMVD